MSESRDALTALVTETFERRIGHAASWRWFVPGRIEMFGKHTDYAGGESLLAAVPRGFVVAAGPRTDEHLRIVDARHQEEILVSIRGGEPFRGWANYGAVTARRLAANFPDAAFGADIVVASNLPRAAGVSSSSALVVGLALALIRRAGLEARADWHAAVPTADHLAWYLGCVENGLGYGTLPGTTGVGTLGGSQDHTAILNCREGHVSHYGFIPVTRLADIPWPDAWRFIVLSSGVHADKAGSVRDRYNRASSAVRALVALWERETGHAQPSLTAALRSAPDADARLRHAIAHAVVPEFSAADLDRRLTMLVRELERIPAAAAAVAATDAAALGALARASQHDTETLLGNQTPETIALARLAYDHGAFAASAFGAGFGGSVWALARTDEAEIVARRWHQAYMQTCRPTGHVEWFTCEPAGGAGEL